MLGTGRLPEPGRGSAPGMWEQTDADANTSDLCNCCASSADAEVTPDCWWLTWSWTEALAEVSPLISAVEI